MHERRVVSRQRDFCAAAESSRHTITGRGLCRPHGNMDFEFKVWHCLGSLGPLLQQIPQNRIANISLCSTSQSVKYSMLPGCVLGYTNRPPTESDFMPIAVVLANLSIWSD